MLTFYGKCLVVENVDEKYSRKVIDQLTDFAKHHGAKGLAWMKAEAGALNGGISKFFADDLQKKIISDFNIKDNDIIFIIGFNSCVPNIKTASRKNN